MELLSLHEEPLGLNRDSLRRVRKRKGSPKWVRKLSKMVETMAKNSAEEVPMGVIAQEIWDVIMELDKDGRRLLKDEAKNKKQQEREKKKKAQAKAKMWAKKEQKRRKQENQRRQSGPTRVRQTTPARPPTPQTPPARTHRANPPPTQTAHLTRTERVNHGMVEAEMGH